MPSDAVEIVEHVGLEPGPAVALLAGVHGDEEEGVLAVQRVGALLAERPLARGTVRAVPIAHPAAYAADQRTSPHDGLDLARSFPGDPAGTPTQRLAHELTERLIRGSDLMIDLHSAGRANAMPMFAGYVDGGDDDVSVRSGRAAVAFAAPLLWEHPAPVPPGRTLTAAIALGIPCIYAEGSGGASLDQRELDLYVGGVLRVLADLGMLAWQPPPGRLHRVVPGGSGDLDAGVTAPCGGRFVAARDAGDVLASGELIGEIVDETGRPVAAITAPSDCTVMFLRRTARIAAGEKVCALAPPAVPWNEESP
jgi:N2-acetyl-L-2,4-diaminobutanoate deacetylase